MTDQRPVYAVFTIYEWEDRVFPEVYTTKPTLAEAVGVALKLVLERGLGKYGLNSMWIENLSDDAPPSDDGENIVWAYEPGVGIDPTGMMARA